MTDPTLPLTPPHGLGWIPSPPDDRDYTFADMVAITRQPLTAVLPTSYVLPAMPPIEDQGATPMCVAFSQAGMKAAEDRKDQGRYFDFDEPSFFAAIGGTVNGAVIRQGLSQLLHVGYPVVGTAADPGHHKIAAYFAIPVTQADLRQAVHDFGPLELGTPWYTSWFRTVGPTGSKRLPAPDQLYGGHAILAVGYNPTGLLLRNSWGADWGDSGNVTMPWPYVLGHVREAWKAVDQVIGLWGPDVPASIRALDPTGKKTQRAFTKVGHQTPGGPFGFGAVIELSDLAAAYRRLGWKYSAPNAANVAVLLKWAAAH